jgi:hypothetical protein
MLQTYSESVITAIAPSSCGRFTFIARVEEIMECTLLEPGSGGAILTVCKLILLIMRQSFEIK